MPSYVVFKSSSYSSQDTDTKRHSRYLVVQKRKCSRRSGPPALRHNSHTPRS